MPLQRCQDGHYFDTDKYSSCPSCGIDAGNESPERPPLQPPPAEGQTIVLGRSDRGVDPVVGWLVCIDGPDYGRDYRLHAERNFVGRGEDMDVRILGDETISRERHSIISFNPKNKEFKVLPGEGRGIVYLNREEVDSPAVLNTGDELEVGRTRLLFVALSGRDHDWD